MLLAGKSIIVIGASGRIGKALGSDLIQQGARLTVADLDLSEWKRFNTVDPVHEVQVDCTDTISVKNLIQICQHEHGRIDGVVNCTYPRAEGLNKSLEDLTFEQFTENLKLHLGSYFLVSKEVALHLKNQKSGSIINFSSIYGAMAPRFEIYEGTGMVQPVTYAAIKAGINHITRYIAKYLKGSSVRINCISPGGILDQQPQEFLDAYADHCLSKGMLEAKDIAGTVSFLLSDYSKYITGQNIMVDDGFSL